jgi:hypothetical protein
MNSQQTEYLNMIASSDDGWKSIPYDKCNTETLLAAVRKCGLALKHITNQTREICMSAIEENNSAVRYLTKKSPAILMSIFKYFPYAAAFVEVEYLTQEICDALVKQGKQYDVLIPAKFRAPRIKAALGTLKGPKIFIEGVQKQTYELCVQALLRDPAQIHKIMHSERTALFYEYAYDRGACKFHEIPKNMVASHEMCIDAVKKSPGNFLHVPKEFLSREVCEIAFAGDAANFAGIPHYFHTPEMERIVAEKCPQHLNSVNVKTSLNDIAELYEIAVKASCMALKYIPDRCKTAKLCKLAMLIDSNVVRFVPKEMLESMPELCMMAVRGTVGMLNMIPPSMRTLEICEIAVTADYRDLAHVPDRMLCDKLCDISIISNLKKIIGIVVQVWHICGEEGR